MASFKKYLVITSTSLQTHLAYMLNFLSDTVFYVVIILIFSNLWRTIYGGSALIDGYTLNQLIWYLIITEFITMCSTTVFEDLGKEIKSGSIAYQLNKPYNFVYYQIFTGIGQISIKFLAGSVFAICLGIIFGGPIEGFKLWFVPFIILSCIAGILLNLIIFAVAGLSAFWLEENQSVYLIVQKSIFIFGMFIPIDFFPRWFKTLSSFLPFQYITYIPAKLVQNFTLESFAIGFGMQMLFIFGMLVIANLIYLKGVKQLNVNGG